MATEVPCAWAPIDDALYRGYHDTEWGVPVHDPRSLWEKFQLDGFQAGLSWITILRKREALRRELDGFDPEKLVRWSDKRIDKALQNAAIIRSPTKIRATIGNARTYLAMQEQGLDFARYIWGFVDGRPRVSNLKSYRDAPAKDALSEQIAKDMKKRGFKFCGPTIVYACLQAVGVVNDHEQRCPRFRAIQKLY